MIHIHDITASPPTHSGYGGGGVRWSCTALRCLHDARGSGIVRVNCLNQTPLTFVEVRCRLKLTINSSTPVRMQTQYYYIISSINRKIQYAHDAWNVCYHVLGVHCVIDKCHTHTNFDTFYF